VAAGCFPLESETPYAAGGWEALVGIGGAILFVGSFIAARLLGFFG